MNPFLAPRIKMADGILKIAIKLPYLNEKLSDFHKIWYTTADLELDDNVSVALLVASQYALPGYSDQRVCV